MQKIYRYDNGFGASIINNPMSNSLELAVLEFDGDDWEIVYDTPIADDVLSYLDLEEVFEIFKQIKALPKRSKWWNIT